MVFNNRYLGFNQKLYHTHLYMYITSIYIYIRHAICKIIRQYTTEIGLYCRYIFFRNNITIYQHSVPRIPQTQILNLHYGGNITILLHKIKTTFVIKKNYCEA